MITLKEKQTIKTEMFNQYGTNPSFEENFERWFAWVLKKDGTEKETKIEWLKKGFNSFINSTPTNKNSNSVEQSQSSPSIEDNPFPKDNQLLIVHLKKHLGIHPLSKLIDLHVMTLKRGFDVDIKGYELLWAIGELLTKNITINQIENKIKSINGMLHKINPSINLKSWIEYVEGTINEFPLKKNQKKVEKGNEVVQSELINKLKENGQEDDTYKWGIFFLRNLTLNYMLERDTIYFLRKYYINTDEKRNLIVDGLSKRKDIVINRLQDLVDKFNEILTQSMPQERIVEDKPLEQAGKVLTMEGKEKIDERAVQLENELDENHQEEQYKESQSPQNEKESPYPFV